MRIINLNMLHPTQADVEFHQREYLAPVLAELKRRKAMCESLSNMVVFEYAVQQQERTAALLEIRAGVQS